MTGAENVQPDPVKIAKLAPAHFAGAHGFVHRPRLSSTNRLRTATACNRRGDLEKTPYWKKHHIALPCANMVFLTLKVQR